MLTSQSSHSYVKQYILRKLAKEAKEQWKKLVGLLECLFFGLQEQWKQNSWLYMYSLSVSLKHFIFNSEFDLKPWNHFSQKVTLRPDNWLHLFVAVSERCSKWAWLIQYQPNVWLSLWWHGQASHIVACGQGNCSGRPGIDVYYWPTS